MFGYLFGLALIYKYNPVKLLTSPVVDLVKQGDAFGTTLKLRGYKEMSKMGTIPDREKFELNRGIDPEYQEVNLPKDKVPELCSKFAGRYYLNQIERSILYAIFLGARMDHEKGRPLRKEWQVLLEYYQELSKARAPKVR